MQRPTRVLIAGLVTLCLGGGGLALIEAHGPVATTWIAADNTGARGVPLLGALRALPTPSRTPGTVKPATTRVSHQPKPSKTPKPTPPPKPKPVTPPAGSSVVNQLLAQINELRAKHDLPPYTVLSGLTRSAHKHNLLMAGSCGMSHQCPGEASLGDRVSAQGVHWTTCGENIGYSGPHPDTAAARVAAAEGLTTAMYNEKPPDDGHRRNLLSTQFHHIGIDVVRDSSGTVWLTQDFSN